jgi:signal peptidase I
MRQRPSALTDGARPLFPEIPIVAKPPNDAPSRRRADAEPHQSAPLKGQRARKAVKSGATATAGGAVEGIKSVLWAVLLFFVIRTFIITAYSIPSESMEESLLIGDYLMANNALFGATIPFTSIKLPSIRDPHPGEIVVFRPGYNEPRIDVVKRVIGVPGDTLQMRDKVIYRNGKRLDESYARYLDEGDDPIPEFGSGMMMDPTVRTDAYGSHNHYPLLVPSVDKRAYRPSRNNWGPLVVPPGKYWLMGDNRDRSLDSRFMGPVPRVDIRGKPLFIYFSYDKMDAYASFPRPITAARWGRIFDRVR